MEKLTVIISYYKALENLKVILEALERQSNPNFEVIISEDDSNPKTIEFYNSTKDKASFYMQHLFQESDTGFRKNEMLNRSIQASRTDKIVFIDGDCIPHKHFVKQYLLNFEEGTFLFGRRVSLGKKLSKAILEKGFTSIALFKLISSDAIEVKESLYMPLLPRRKKQKGLVGCNWGIERKYLLNVNGFDEDYTSAGVGEDVDIEWRLKEAGIRPKSMKYKAIVYHLWHPRSYSDEKVQQNYRLFEEKKKNGHLFCVNGIDKTS